MCQHWTGQPTLSVSPLITNFTADRRQAQPRGHILILTNSERRWILGEHLALWVAFFQFLLLPSDFKKNKLSPIRFMES